ncbi:hypothetical protein [Abyssibius alkaniclasticus]|uniref:hypothetical protein n=1 Tax=Abyssibius alkaniclasticus TaxID=2881234 RepID=UPI004058F952
MKIIGFKSLAVALLASASVAQAEVTFGGQATLGYNSESNDYISGSITAEFGSYALTFGQTTAASDLYVDFEGMPYRFYEPTRTTSGRYREPFLVRGDAQFGATQIAVSYETGLNSDGFNGLAVGLRTMVGAIELSAAYQSEGLAVGCCGIEGTGSVIGAGAGFTLGDVKATLAYTFIDHTTWNEQYNALGLQVEMQRNAILYSAYIAAGNADNSAPISNRFNLISYGAAATYDYGQGAVRGYANSSNAERGAYYGVDLSYGVGDDIALYAGYRLGDVDGAYAGVIYSGLREGVELGASYSEVDAIENVDGGYFFNGTTVWMSLAF